MRNKVFATIRLIAPDGSLGEGRRLLPYFLAGILWPAGGGMTYNIVTSRHVDMNFWQRKGRLERIQKTKNVCFLDNV
jgi:hypothetical protein